ncbi:uncharacterized protein B0H18DRAFT_974568 [Fomitopsis serialis]|uniref:uncharacterized protein n=1 Tax=Fomitopsis serialis TaxID=139415 RepID=UPI002007278C|nr:uncharacterized protein B0H18DRAFT_974568 [Neoantrodia serialis]KAH9936599.1 hypothetical protein B0H18DRAFT_974568 [Neoantrodia serialis]
MLLGPCTVCCIPVGFTLAGLCRQLVARRQDSHVLAPHLHQYLVLRAVHLVPVLHVEVAQRPRDENRALGELALARGSLLGGLTRSGTGRAGTRSARVRQAGVSTAGGLCSSSPCSCSKHIHFSSLHMTATAEHGYIQARPGPSRYRPATAGTGAARVSRAARGTHVRGTTGRARQRAGRRARRATAGSTTGEESGGRVKQQASGIVGV